MALISVISRKLSGVNPFVLNFWYGLFGVIAFGIAVFVESVVGNPN